MRVDPPQRSARSQDLVRCGKEASFSHIDLLAAVVLLEPSGDVAPTPEGAADVPGNRSWPVSGPSATTDQRRDGLPASSYALGDVGGGHQLVGLNLEDFEPSRLNLGDGRDDRFFQADRLSIETDAVPCRSRFQITVVNPGLEEATRAVVIDGIA